MIRHCQYLIIALLTVVSQTVTAEQAKTFGDYTVHYVAFTTDVLAPSVAKSYRIQRSKNRALINVSVLKKVMGTTVKPVKAKVEVEATNLSAQLRQLETRAVEEVNAIYYIAETTVNDGETLKYTVKVTPEGGDQSYTFSFQQQFVTDY